jgi:RNA polymerase I-specific transcription initiation factor RRN3
MPCGATGQEQEEEGDDPEEDEHEDIFELEGMSELEISAQAAAAAAAAAAGQEQPGPRGGWEGSAQQQRVQSGAAASTSAPVVVDEAADKLDSMMELVFEHLGRRCDAGEEHHGKGWATPCHAYHHRGLIMTACAVLH